MSVEEELVKIDERLEELVEYAEKDTTSVYCYSNITYYLTGAKHHVEDVLQYINDKKAELRAELKRDEEGKK